MTEHEHETKTPAKKAAAPPPRGRSADSQTQGNEHSGPDVLTAEEKPKAPHTSTPAGEQPVFPEPDPSPLDPDNPPPNNPPLHADLVAAQEEQERLNREAAKEAEASKHAAGKGETHSPKK